jgi:hypothetical protein
MKILAIAQGAQRMKGEAAREGSANAHHLLQKQFERSHVSVYRLSFYFW